MEITTERIKELRDKSGAGIMDCRNALMKTAGDFDKALEVLKQNVIAKVEKKSQRIAEQGIVEAYLHTGSKIGAMVEINCETDFVARTEVFKTLAHNIAMQVAAQEPICISEDQLPKDNETAAEVACLLKQPFIRNPEFTIQDLINEAIGKTGENIKVKRFARFELGQVECQVAGIK